VVADVLALHIRPYHITPYLCPAIKGEKQDKDMEKQHKNLKAVLKWALKDHNKVLRSVTTIVVATP